MHHYTTRRGLAWLLLIAAIYFVGDRVGAFALGNLVNRSGLRFSSAYAGRVHAEVVCLGNSRGVHSFPAVLLEDASGRPTVNLSYNGMTPQVCEAIFRDYLERNDAPKLVIIDPSFVITETATNTVLNYSPYFEQSTRLRQLAAKYDSSFAVSRQLSRLLSFNSEMFLRAMAFLDSSDQGQLNSSVMPEALLAETEAMKPFDLEIVADELKSLVAIVDLCREKKIEVRLVLPCYLPAYRAKIANLDAWRAKIEKATGLPVRDLSGSIERTGAFADRLHLNAEGSREFAKLLVEEGIVPAREG